MKIYLTFTTLFLTFALTSHAKMTCVRTAWIFADSQDQDTSQITVEVETSGNKFKGCPLAISESDEEGRSGGEVIHLQEFDRGGRSNCIYKQTVPTEVTPRDVSGTHYHNGRSVVYRCEK